MTMRIRTSDRLGGQSITTARRLVHRLRGEDVDVEAIMQILTLERIPATRLLNGMIADSYIAPDPRHPDVWKLTEKAARLAHATAAHPMTRAVADKTLAGVISRAHALNQLGSDFAFTVGSVFVFGSYLSDAQLLNDLDVAVEWEPRFKERDEQLAYEKARVRLARERGRTFSNYSNELFFPKDEVRLFLKGRNNRISLHDFSEEREFLETVPKRLVYSKGSVR